MKLSIPFIPDEKYINFLKTRAQNIESVYFSLHHGPLLDARMRFSKASLTELSQGLAPFRSIKKYVLLNSRFISPQLYSDTKFLNQTLDKLETLKTDTGLTGLVFSDAYLLNALSSTKRDIIAHLEAVPGINCMLDSATKAFAFIDHIERAGFQKPGKLILDRSLNRDLKALANMGQSIKSTLGQIKIELLANEGCIYHCPFKLAHDSQIAYTNLSQSSDKNFLTNQSIGCHAYFHDLPWQFFKSPFIRPEDTDKYQHLADTIKICGRTLGINFLSTCVQAYSERSYSGNLLELMDATHWLSDLYHIENKKLDPDFLKLVSGCTKECKNCSICHDLFEKTAIKKTIGLKSYRDYI